MPLVSPGSPAVHSAWRSRAVKKFERESPTGVYYAPFNTNSKNYWDIPKETERWYERLVNLLQASAQPRRQKEHTQAVARFRILHGLIRAMENGDRPPALADAEEALRRKPDYPQAKEALRALKGKASWVPW